MDKSNSKPRTLQCKGGLACLVVLAGVVGLGLDAPGAEGLGQLVGVLLEGAVHDAGPHLAQVALLEELGDGLPRRVPSARCGQGRQRDADTATQSHID